MMTAFTRNYEDNSTEAGFQFTFYFDSLSEQEQILVSLVLDGHTESSVAKMMNITLNTEKSYRKNVYSKLNIHSKRELFDLANSRK